MPKPLRSTATTNMRVLLFNNHLPYLAILIVCEFTWPVQAFERKSLNLGRQITKVTFSEQSDFIFVGGHNFISVLTPDLQEILRVDVGPVEEDEFCHPVPAPCDNNVTVLEFDVMNNGLLVCGTAYQGTCVLHDALDLSMYSCIDAPTNRTSASRVSASKEGQTVIQILDTVAEEFTFTDPNFVVTEAPENCRSFAYGNANFHLIPASRMRPIIFDGAPTTASKSTDATTETDEVKPTLPGTDKENDEGEGGGEGGGGGGENYVTPPTYYDVAFVTRILVASWEKPSETDTKESQPIISLRSIRDDYMAFTMGFPNGQSASNTGIHVKPELAHNFEMKFKHAFTIGNFTYLLSLRSNSCDAKTAGNGKCTITVLSRVGNTNPLMTPYIEMPLSCTNRKKVKHDLLLSFAVGKVNSHANGSDVEITVLIAAFGKEKTPGSQIPDPSGDTAICAFSIESFNFKNYQSMCQSGLPGHGPPIWMKDTEVNCSNGRHKLTSFLVPSGEHTEHKGHVLAVMTHTPQFRASNGIALSDKMHVYTADQNGQIHKFSLEAEKVHFGYGIKIVTPPELVYNLELDMSSLTPTSHGVTDHRRAVTYLTYETKIISLSLDYCRQFGTCSLCQQKSKECRWCPNIHSCLEADGFQIRCNEDPMDSCPPDLVDFHPKDVPVSGGSIITLRGMHLGLPNQGFVGVTICNQTCDHVKPSRNTLECVVRAKCEGCSDKCYLEVKVEQEQSHGVTSSRTIPNKNQLTYVVPRVTSISPTYGPVSGEVIVTVRGEHLNVGTRSHLDVMGTRCIQILSTMTNALTCLMERAQSLRRGCGPMTLKIDNYVTVSNGTQYCFREDPRIRQVEPTATFIDGGLTLDVTGLHLDSVSRMQFEVTASVVEGNSSRPETFLSECQVKNATSMTCKTPDMDRLRKAMEIVEYSPGYLSAIMAFLVDNRSMVKMFLSNKFLIYPMPKFYRVIENSKESYIYRGLKNKLFPIKAQNIPEWLKPSDVKVFVGRTECPVRNITFNTIFCNVKPVLRAYREDLRSTTTTTTTKTTPLSPVPDTTSPDAETSSEISKSSGQTVTTGGYNVTNNSTLATTTTVAVIHYSSFSSWLGKRRAMEFVEDLSDEEDDMNKTRRGRSGFRDDDIEKIDKSQREAIQYQLEIQIGKYRITLGSVNVGPIPDDIVNPPEIKAESSGVDVFLIGGLVGAGVILILALSVVCVVLVTKKKRRAKRHPFYMNEIPSSYPGSSEVSMPTLTQILESELEPNKKADIGNLIISSDRLIMGKAIGSGNFGCVYEGMLAPKAKESPMKVAIKTLQDPVTHSINLREFVKEAIIMVGFQHPHVLGLVGLVETEMGVPYVVLPYMDNGDLLTYVRDPDRILSLYDVIEFGIDICSGMAYLSSVKLVHRDLAARNCMLDNEYRGKVADFGLCRDIYEKGYYTSDNKKKLPIRWMAVESIERGAYSTKSDVWSMGVVLWELLSRGVTPYPGVDGWDIVNYLRKRRLSPPYFCPDELFKLMMTCWAKDPDMRPTFKTLQKELCLLTGHDPGSGSTTPVINRSARTSGRSNALQPSSSKATDEIKKSNPEIQITPGTPREDLAQVQIELKKLEKSDQPGINDKESRSVMSLPRSQAVKNVMITIPACHSSRDITKAAAANYLQLVDNYEPAPRFANPFHRSKKKHSKSETRKMGSRKERDSSSHSKGGSEKRATPNDYAIPFNGERARVSGDMSDSHGRGPVDSLIAIHRPAGSNYFELETNSLRSSVNSILDGRSSGGSSFMAGPVRSVPGRLHDQIESGTNCSSAAMSCQSLASSEDLTGPENNGNQYDRLSADYIVGEGEQDRHYHSWKEPEVELRVNENVEGYDRLCSEFMDPRTSTTMYPRWQNPEMATRPDSNVPKYSRISELEMESDTTPYYQISDNLGEEGEPQEEYNLGGEDEPQEEEDVITSL